MFKPSDLGRVVPVQSCHVADELSVIGGAGRVSLAEGSELSFGSGGGIRVVERCLEGLDKGGKICKSNNASSAINVGGEPALGGSTEIRSGIGQLRSIGLVAGGIATKHEV